MTSVHSFVVWPLLACLLCGGLAARINPRVTTRYITLELANATESLINPSSVSTSTPHTRTITVGVEYANTTRTSSTLEFTTSASTVSAHSTSDSTFSSSPMSFGSNMVQSTNSTPSTPTSFTAVVSTGMSSASSTTSVPTSSSSNPVSNNTVAYITGTGTLTVPVPYSSGMSIAGCNVSAYVVTYVTPYETHAVCVNEKGRKTSEPQTFVYASEPASCTDVPSGAPVPEGCYSTWLSTAIIGDLTGSFTVETLTESAAVRLETQVFTSGTEIITRTAMINAPHIFYDGVQCALAGVNCPPYATSSNAAISSMASRSAYCKANGTAPTNLWSTQLITHTSTYGISTSRTLIWSSMTDPYTFSLSDTTYTTAVIDPTQFWITSEIVGPSTGISTWIQTTSHPASACCGFCALHFQRVDIYYFPPSNVSTSGVTQTITTSPTQSAVRGSMQRRYDAVIGQYAVVSGATLTSPSVYGFFHTVYASDGCGLVGKSTYADFTLSFAPGELSTASGMWAQQQGFWPLTTQVFDPHSVGGVPVIAAPSKLLNYDPAWVTCSGDYWQGFDPPHQITSVEGLGPIFGTSTSAPVMPTTSADPTLIPTAAPVQTIADPSVAPTSKVNDPPADPSQHAGISSVDPVVTGNGQGVDPKQTTPVTTLPKASDAPQNPSPPKGNPPADPPPSRAGGTFGPVPSPGTETTRAPTTTVGVAPTQAGGGASPSVVGGVNAPSQDPPSDANVAPAGNGPSIVSTNIVQTNGGQVQTVPVYSVQYPPSSAPQIPQPASPPPGLGAIIIGGFSKSNAQVNPQSAIQAEGSQFAQSLMSVTVSPIPAYAGPSNQGNAQGQPAVTGGLKAGETVTVSPIPSASLRPAAIVTVGSQVASVINPSAVVFGGQTVHAGSPAATINGQTVSFGVGGNLAVGSDTVQVPSATNSPHEAPQAIATVGGQVVSVGSSGLAVGGAPLRQGQTHTIGGTPIHVEAAGLVVGTSTIAIPASAAGSSNQIMTSAPSPIAVIAGNTITYGNPTTTINNTPYYFGSQGIVSGSQTIPMSASNTAPPIYTAGGIAFTANPTGFAIAGTTLSPGGAGVTVSGTPISLGPSGLLAVGGSTISLSSTPSSQTNIMAIGGQIISANPTGFAVAGTTLSPGGAGVTVSGTPISLGPSGLLAVGSSTIFLPGATSQSNIMTIGGQMISANPTGFAIAGTTLSPGGPGIIVSGTPVSLGPSGLLAIGGSTTSLNAPPKSNIFTVGGKTFTANPTGFSIAGMTISPGGKDVTVSGTPISLGPSGVLVIGSSTATVGTTTPTSTQSGVATGSATTSTSGLPSAPSSTQSLPPGSKSSVASINIPWAVATGVCFGLWLLWG